MPLSVLEVLSYGIPCVVTLQINMADLIEENSCGWGTELEPRTICQIFFQAMQDYKIKRASLIQNARSFI